MANLDGESSSTPQDAYGDCPICYESYSQSDRITCSAENGCRTFHMCRLCVYRQAVNLADPFVVDEETGDFATIDPTACPQCKRPGAFVDQRLPSLPHEVQRSVEEEGRRTREGMAQRAMERMLQHLRGAPTLCAVNGATNYHPVMRQLSGIQNCVYVSQQRGGDASENAAVFFGDYATIGIPDLFTTSGILYFEVRVIPTGTAQPNVKMGFSLLNGMPIAVGRHTGVGVGENRRSWGFDALGCKIHGELYADQRFISNWEQGSVMGFAANVDTGMIAYSKDGNWDIINGCGVKFENETIKNGVYPCISARQCQLQVRTGSKVQFGPPPASIFDCWPKYEDSSWIMIPADAREAAIKLGYTQLTWTGTGNSIEDKGWHELTEEEQSAGKILGYNEVVWSQLTTLWKRDAEESSSEDEDSMSLSGFSVMFWRDLPRDARNAALTLGYNQTNWDEDTRIPLDEKPWEELSRDQQRAAIILGYDSQTWNENVDSDVSDGSSCYFPFDHLLWSELPPNALRAAENLGYTPEIWDNDQDGPLDDHLWTDLTLVEQMAAVVLGFDERSWNQNMQ